jgi:hypothetical protein
MSHAIAYHVEPYYGESVSIQSVSKPQVMFQQTFSNPKYLSLPSTRSGPVSPAMSFSKGVCGTTTASFLPVEVADCPAAAYDQVCQRSSVIHMASKPPSICNHVGECVAETYRTTLKFGKE